MKALDYLLPFVAGALFGAALAFSVMSQKRPVQPDIVVQTDTLFVRDTIVEIRPEIREIRQVDTVLFPVVDTLLRTDTVFVKLPREQKVYSDDSTYRAVVSGVLPFLDTISVYPRTIIVTQRVRERGGSLIVPTFSAGYGVAVPPGAKPVAAPWVGVGVGVDLGEAWRRLRNQKN